MSKNIVFLLLFLSVTVAFAWALSRTNNGQNQTISKFENATQGSLNSNANEKPVGVKKHHKDTGTEMPNRLTSSQQQFWADQLAADIRFDLQNNQWTMAVNRINDNYSKASSADLARFKTIVLQQADTLIKNKSEAAASALLKSYADTFDDADAWNRLSVVSAASQQWDATVNSLLKLSSLQVSPEEHLTTLKRLVRASSHVRTSLENRNDELGILALYQRIYDQHPDYPRFQLELAQAHIRLGDQIAARPYLDALQYDPEIGALAKQNLASIDVGLNATSQPLEVKPTKLVSHGQIVVPLRRSGNSYLVDVSINTRPMHLLLDTGASITSLSSQTIQGLGLKPTGRIIKLSTANGLTDARLFYAESINLGRLRLKNITVAEVDFGQNSRLDGLLGTDVLNQMKDRYSYIIDNQQNALIFRAK